MSFSFLDKWTELINSSKPVFREADEEARLHVNYYAAAGGLFGQNKMMQKQ